MPSDSAPDQAQKNAVAQHLLAHRPHYLAFVRARVESAEVAEDLLQDAVARALMNAESLRGPVDPWFFRTLRNAIVDHRRRRSASARAIEALANEPQPSSPEPEETRRPCACVLRLQRELKPEYAKALEQVAIEDLPVKEFAQRHGISVTNAGVRLFRARQALRKNVVLTCGTCASDGCRDCRCGESDNRQACGATPRTC